MEMKKLLPYLLAKAELGKNNKKGSMVDTFQNVLLVAIIGVLFIVVIYLFNNLGSTFTASSSAANAASSLTTQFANQIPLVGILVAIVLIVALIGALVGIFVFRGRA